MLSTVIATMQRCSTQDTISYGIGDRRLKSVIRGAAFAVYIVTCHSYYFAWTAWLISLQINISAGQRIQLSTTKEPGGKRRMGAG